MELKEDAEERAKQIETLLDDVNVKPEAIIDLYDSWQDKYDEDLSTWGYLFDKHLDEFEDFVRIGKNSRILDVAAGTGIVGQKLKERGYANIDALDGSKGMLEKAKEKGIYKNYIHAMLGPYPIEGVEKDVYDAVFCAGALGPTHVSYSCFESMAAITKPGGYVYILGAVEWLFDQRDNFEDKMKQIQEEGIWRWVLMKESPNLYYKDTQALIYAFRVLK